MSRTSLEERERTELPSRMHRPSLLTLVIVLVVGSLLVHGWTQGAAVRLDSLATGVFRLGGGGAARAGAQRECGGEGDSDSIHRIIITF